MTANRRIEAIEAAKMLGTCRQTVYKMIYSGAMESEKIDGRLYVAMDDLIGLIEERRRVDQLLSCRQVGDMLGVTGRFIQAQVSNGKLQCAPERHRIHGGYLIDPESVADYWREHLNSACVRCGILGEATPGLGFMCVACEYETRTGRLYRWPKMRRSSAVRNGRLQAWGLVE